MKTVGRNVLVGLLCVVILLVIGFFVFAKGSEPQEGILSVAEDVTSAEIVYEEKVYLITGKQLEELMKFFKELKAAEYDVDTGEEEKGIILKFWAGGKEIAKYGVVDKETIVSYACDPDAMIWIFKTETDVEDYLLKFVEGM